MLPEPGQAASELAIMLQKEKEKTRREPWKQVTMHETQLLCSSITHLFRCEATFICATKLSQKSNYRSRMVVACLMW